MAAGKDRHHVGVLQRERKGAICLHAGFETRHPHQGNQLSALLQPRQMLTNAARRNLNAEEATRGMVGEDVRA